MSSCPDGSDIFRDIVMCKWPWSSLSERHLLCDSLETRKCSSPKSPLGVVPDSTINFHPNPLENGTIPFLFLGQELFDPESLVRRRSKGSTTHTTMAEKGRESKITSPDFYFPLMKTPIGIRRVIVRWKPQLMYVCDLLVISRLS